MATEELKVKITANASQAQAEIGKFKKALKGTTDASDESDKSLKNLKSTMNNLKAAVKGDIGAMAELPAVLRKVAIGAAAVIAAVKTLKGLVKNAINVAAMGDEIKDNAQKVFMSTTAYQEWGYVLKQNGIEISALKTGMRQFSQKVAAGDAALKKYGVTATNVEDAFQQAVFNIQNLGSETEKIAAATELFGSRALELFPILNLTNQETMNLMESYRLLGGTMSNELIQLSDTCTDSITAMKAAWGGLANLLAQALLPTIIKIIQWLTLLIAKVRIVLAAVFGIKSTFGSSNKKNSIAGASASTAGSTGKTAKNLGKAAKKAKELRKTLMGIDELTRLVEQATSSAGSGGGGGGGAGGIGDIGAGGLEDIGDILTDDQLENLRKFQEIIQKIADPLHAVYLILKALVELSFGNFKGAWNDVKEAVTLLFPKLKDIKGIWESLKTKAVNLKVTLTDGFSKAWNKIKKAWGSIKNKTATIKLAFTEGIKNKWNAIAKKVNDARAKGGLAKTLLPAMPLLAKGGVLTSPMAAVMGEYAGARQNPEIATPQSLMYETIQKANGDLVSAFATMTRQVIAAIENKDLEVKIGDEQIARSAQRGNTAYYNRTGKALLTI